MSARAKRQTFAALALAGALAVIGAATSGCKQEGPRALVLVDAAAHAEGVAAIAKRYESERHRAVRVIHVAKPEEALRIAMRGDADVALVPHATPHDDLDKRNDGAVRATIDAGGESLDVIEVNAVAHPTVDAAGARDLAGFIAAR